MIIYKRTNTINNKVYIGKTKTDEITRWKNCVYDAKNSTSHLANAINLYGHKVFKSEVIYYAKTEHELKRMETFFIILHQSHNPKYGYNMTLGGDKENYPNEEMKVTIRKKISYRLKRRIGRTPLRICYGCFKPFNVAIKSNYEGVFCSISCRKVINIFREKRNKPAWNKGLSNITVFGEVKAEELRIKNSNWHKTHPSNRKGKKNSPSHRSKISAGKKGRVWITNGVQSKLVRKMPFLSPEWKYGVTRKKSFPSSLFR